MPTAAKPMGVKAFARLLDVSPAAVRRAAADSRLTEASVGRNARGHLVIHDPAAARREWRAHTRVRIGIDTEGPRRGDDGPTPRSAGPGVQLGEAYDALQSQIVAIEKALSAAFRDQVKRCPDAPATRWKAVYAKWAELAERLVGLSDAVRTALPLLPPFNPQEETEAHGHE